MVVYRETDIDALQALVIIVEKARETQHLPAALASEVIGQSLQLRQHHVLHVVVVEYRVEQEAVLASLVPDRVVPAHCVVKQSLPCSLRPQMDRLLAGGVGHQLSQILLKVRARQLLGFGVAGPVAESVLATHAAGRGAVHPLASLGVEVRKAPGYFGTRHAKWVKPALPGAVEVRRVQPCDQLVVQLLMMLLLGDDYRLINETLICRSDLLFQRVKVLLDLLHLRLVELVLFFVSLAQLRLKLAVLRLHLTLQGFFRSFLGS